MSLVNKTWSETHEKVCAQRYGEITESLRAINRALLWMCAGVFSVVLGVLGTYVFQYGVTPQMKERGTVAAPFGK